MSKVLISFIGTGKISDKGKAKREYEPATYKLAEKEMSTPFIAKALKEFVEPDKIFLIGTPHSMWEDVYRSFADHPDDDVWTEIGDWCEKADEDTPAEGLPHKEAIEQAIGDGSRIFLIRYGIDEEQIQQNINIILGMRTFLNNGDEIIVDITHSFRSLPLLIMQLILYLKQIDSPKVKVTHVYYGMLEVSQKLGYTPVVDISSMISLSDWITAAFTFKLNGSSKQAAALLKNEGGESAASLLEKFSSVSSLNDMRQLQNQVQELRAIKYPSQMASLAQLALEPTVDAFINKFKNLTPSEFQYRLAEWHYNNGNYFAAYNDLVECIVTKVCEETPGYEWDDYNNRQSVRDAYKAVNSKNPSDTDRLYCTDQLVKIYQKINPIRNYLVHLAGNSAGKSDAKGKISTLGKAIKDLKAEIGRHATPPTGQRHPVG